MPGRVLVLANGFVEDAPEALPTEVRKLLDGADEVRVIAPALTTRLEWLVSDVDGARVEADARLTKVLEGLRGWGVEAAGGTAGREDQLRAITEILANFPAEEIVLAVHAPEDANWHERDLPNLVRERFGLPTHAFLIGSDGRVVDEMIA